MKLSQERYDPDFGNWRPVKLSRRERHEIYLALKAGMPTANWAGRIPFPQLEAIWKEFHPGEPWRAAKVFVKSGIVGNRWYCENGCGTVMLAKSDAEVFKAPDRSKSQRYFCKACLKEHQERRKAAELVNSQVPAAEGELSQKETKETKVGPDRPAELVNS